MLDLKRHFQDQTQIPAGFTHHHSEDFTVSTASRCNCILAFLLEAHRRRFCSGRAAARRSGLAKTNNFFIICSLPQQKKLRSLVLEEFACTARSQLGLLLQIKG